MNSFVLGRVTVFCFPHVIKEWAIHTSFVQVVDKLVYHIFTGSGWQFI